MSKRIIATAHELTLGVISLSISKKIYPRGRISLFRIAAGYQFLNGSEQRMTQTTTMTASGSDFFFSVTSQSESKPGKVGLWIWIFKKFEIIIKNRINFSNLSSQIRIHDSTDGKLTWKDMIRDDVVDSITIHFFYLRWRAEKWINDKILHIIQFSAHLLRAFVTKHKIKYHSY